MRGTRTSLLALSAIVAAAVPTLAQKPGELQAQAADFSKRAAEIDRIFAAEAAKGGSFVVRYDLGGHSFAKGYGHLDCARSKPIPSNALIDSGSISKAFTYAAIYKLIEEGRLKLDDSLGDLFAEVPADKRPITVAQLLDERSGFHDFVNPDGSVPSTDVEVIVRDYLPLSKSQLLRSAFASPLRYAPGTREEYSNLAYQLLAAIVEKASGKGYEAYVREKILLPAGMKDTGYVLPDFHGKVFAEQCKGAESWGNPVSKGLWKNGVSWNLMGAGGMMTTVADLKRWTDASTSGVLFRPDIQARFRRSSFFSPSYERCRTEVSAVAGSNNLTFAVYYHLPMRKEALIAASTRSEHRVPRMLGVLCLDTTPEG